MSVFSFGELHKYSRAQPRQNYVMNDEIMSIQEFDGQVRSPPSTGNATSISARSSKTTVVLASVTLQTLRSIAQTRTANTRIAGNATNITNATTA